MSLMKKAFKCLCKFNTMYETQKVIVFQVMLAKNELIHMPSFARVCSHINLDLTPFFLTNGVQQTM